MGMQGLPARAPVNEWIAGKGRRRRVAAIIPSLLLPVLVGCSSNSSWSGNSWSANPAPSQTAAVVPPPSAPAPPAQPAAAPSASRTTSAPAASTDGVVASPYPTVSLIDIFKEGTPSIGSSSASNAPRPPTTYTPSGQPYSPPPSGQTAAAAPQSAPAPEPADNSAISGYPSESLYDLFRK